MLNKIRNYTSLAINMIKFYTHKDITFGKKLRCVGKIGIHIDRQASLVIGDNFSMISGHMINPIGRNIRSYIRIDKGAQVTIGDNVGISCAVLRSKKKITIGNNVKIGADAIIIDTDAHSLDYEFRRSLSTDAKNAKSAEVKIGDDVFIGSRSVITKGVTIGDRSIVAIGSIVTKSIPCDEIWGGNPAKFIKKLSALQ